MLHLYILLPIIAIQVLRLNRKAGESIIITAGDDQIVVTVDKIERSFVRISVEAPRRIVVDRSEIHEKRRKP